MALDGPLLLVVAALVAFVAGWALSGWARTICASSSRWLRPWSVGTAAALLAGGAVLPATSWWEIAPFWLLGVSGALLVTSDLAVMRLPDPVMAVAYPAFLLPLLVTALATGQWSRLGMSLLAGIVLLLFYLVNALLFRGGIFLGDVKYAGLLGVWLGWFGWGQVVWGTLLAGLLGGLVGIAIIVSRRGNRRSEFPYGPMMAVGAWLAALMVV